jgi:phosphocarrier protein
VNDNKEVIREITVINKLGIHARPSSMIVQTANKYNADLFVSHDKEDEVNAKSIMGVMMLAAGQGTKLRFRAVGPDAEELLEEIEKLIKSKFNEE